VSAVYMSFADDTGWLGAVLTDDFEVEDPTLDVYKAIEIAHQRGVNPGGEVLTWLVESHLIPEGVPRWKLMSKEELEVFGPLSSVTTDD
jgi:hypothetical protein